MITLRRYYLDKALSEHRFSGKVLDVGGKKNNKRGVFRHDSTCIDSWEYLNTDASTNPDYCCSAESIPVGPNVYTQVLLAEVIEHLRDPETVLKEVYRVLEKGGVLIMTMPFLYAIHADPYDYQRWTPEKIKIEMNLAGFDRVDIRPMGSIFSVIYDLFHVSLNSASRNKSSITNKVLMRYVMPLAYRACKKLDIHYLYKSRYITTGYFVVCEK